MINRNGDSYYSISLDRAKHTLPGPFLCFDVVSHHHSRNTTSSEKGSGKRTPVSGKP